MLTKRLKGWISQLRQRHIGFNRFGDRWRPELLSRGAGAKAQDVDHKGCVEALLADVLAAHGAPEWPAAMKTRLRRAQSAP